ncbi:MAG: DUF1549 domain-containing protein [Pirellulaceae bacterium]
MPPPDSHKQLKPEQVTVLKQWIEAGAPSGGHWSFQPIAAPDVPTSTWGYNPIDAFIFQQLQSAGLQPNEEAQRERLLRRVTLALTGLPPTLEELDAFLSDDSPDAYEKVVDRLLMSQHFGELHGVAMDGRRSVRRHERLSCRRTSRHVAVARLGDRSLQPQHALQ